VKRYKRNKLFIWRKIMLKAIIIILFIVASVSIAFYLMPIKIKFKVSRVNADDIIIVRVKTLYGVVNIKFEVPLLDIVFVNNKLGLKYKATVESNKTNKLWKKVSKVFTAHDFKNIKRYFHHDPVFFQKMLDYWSNQLIINDFSFILKYGTNDAAFTALLYGTIWTILGPVLAILYNNLRFNTKDIIITPYFDKVDINVEFSCIIKFKFGDIINTGIMLFRRRIQRKEIKQEIKDTMNAS
jgi:hypothetical protein